MFFVIMAESKSNITFNNFSIEKFITVSDFSCRKEGEILIENFDSDSISSFEIEIRPCNDNYVSVLLRRSESALPHRLKISCSVCVIDACGTARLMQSFGHEEGDERFIFTFGLVKYISRKILLDSPVELVPNNVLRLHFEGYVTVYSNVDQPLRINILESRSVGTRFVKDFTSKMYESIMERSDVLFFEHGENGAIAKSKLRDFTMRMLDAGERNAFYPREPKNSGTDGLTDFDPYKAWPILDFMKIRDPAKRPGLRKLLFANFTPPSEIYLFRHKFARDVKNVTYEDIVELYKMATQYVHPPLKNECVNFLVRNTTLLNVRSISAAGRLFDEDILERSADSFLQKTTGRSADCLEDVFRLYELSIENENLDLRYECLRCMRLNMYVETVEKIFTVAEEHREEQLLADVAKFIVEHTSEVIVSGQREIEKWFLNNCFSAYGIVRVSEEEETDSARFEFYR